MAPQLTVDRVWRLLGIPLLLCACAETVEEGPPLLYRNAGHRILPFPTDAVAEPADTPTGLKLTFGPQGTNLGDVDEALFLLGDDFIDTLDRLDGWSTLAAAFAPVPEPIDPDTLDRMLLIDLAEPALVDVRRETLGGETSFGKQVHWLSARPLRPLRPATRHALVLMRGLRSEKGRPFVRPQSYDPELPRLSGLDAALSALDLDPDDVLIADVFTTQSIGLETDVLIAAHRSGPAPVVTLDDVFQGDITVDPRGNVPTDRTYPAIRALARARFTLPSYRADVDGPLIVDHRGAELQGEEEVEVLALIPHGEGPFPVVVYHHGIGATKELVFDYANGIAETGAAIVAIDGPLHGFRTDRPGNAATRFLNIAQPALILDNFRQAETDQIYFLRALDELAKKDLLGSGRPVLDTSRLFYVGESLGSMIGAATIGIEPRFEGAALLVAGGTLLEFFDRVLSGFEFDGFPTRLFTAVAQAALDRGDPTNYARRSLDRQILLIQAMEDDVIPARASEALAVAMDLPQVGAVHQPADAVPDLASPVMRRGWTQHANAGHDLFHDEGTAAYDVARDQLFHYLRTWVDTGTAEIR